jgi:hypothetical protein
MPTETANGQTVQPEFREKLVEKIEKLMTDGSPDASDPRLANVFVFDSFSADHYVSYDNSAAAFTPYGLAVLPTLSRVCDQLAARLNTDISVWTTAISSVSANWNFDPGTKVGQLIQNLSKATKESEVALTSSAKIKVNNSVARLIFCKRLCFLTS